MAVAPGIPGRLTNTDALVKLVILVDTTVQSWSPTDVKPASIHVDSTGSSEIIFDTAVVILVLSGHLSLVGLNVGECEGTPDGIDVGLRVGAGVVGMKLGRLEGNDDGTDEGSAGMKGVKKVW